MFAVASLPARNIRAEKAARKGGNLINRGLRGERALEFRDHHRRSLNVESGAKIYEFIIHESTDEQHRQEPSE